MALRKLSGDSDCKSGTCPTLWETEDNTAFLVQGYVVTDPEQLAQIDLPQGETVARVHVLASPLTDYLRYELSAYPGNIAAGETIGIIDRAARPVAGLPDHDFWLFDDTDAYRMHYTADGRFTGAEHLPAEATPEYRRYQRIAETNAVPFAEYWRQHRP
ncbi:DUF6879 family protein [Kitasatospora purpeofusca]|uniref:DUF6879 family protein n=1 Tax=Kitasatospora purpeofusca TaxID=67352 RepID=UPI002A5A7041|nr:DUF6879 family protein [Kitasatospora purpeofusca]MDY0811868.1 hypothetical protein [Kitasatospora purpeofusca]